jgi:hypothetical protein
MVGADPISIAGLVLALVHSVRALVHEYERISKVPEKLRKFQSHLEEFSLDARLFEQILEQRNQPLIGTQSLEETLYRCQQLVEKYGKKFSQHGNKSQTFYNSVKFTFKDEEVLNELQRDIQQEYFRLTYRSQLLLQ